jgi:S1-C subfamily serine protease
MVDPIKLKPAGLPQLVGKVVGFDEANDLAVLKVENLTAPPLSLRLDPACLGEICIAIGSPLGLQESASFGIVSGVSRQGKGSSGVIIEEMIQTDASVNPGNSGGPLIDSRGKVIGINTMGHGETVNFAVSSEIINDIVPELITFGESRRASIGITIATTWHQQKNVLCQMIEVRSVKRAESPLRQGDLIVKVNSTDIKRRIDIRKALYRDTLGKEVSVVVDREGTLLELKVLAS